jgi:ribosomal protein L30E
MILKSVKAIIINSSTKRGARKEITGGSEDLAGLPWCLWLHSPKDLGCVCSKQHTQRCLQFRSVTVKLPTKK